MYGVTRVLSFSYFHTYWNERVGVIVAEEERRKQCGAYIIICSKKRVKKSN